MKQKRLKKLNRSTGGTVGILIVLTLIGAFMAMPLVYAISNSIKPFDELFVYPPRFFAKNPTFDNFKDLLTVMSSSWVPFTRYLFNTVFVTVVGTVGHIILASLAAYSLSKFEFKGRDTMFQIVVLSLMFTGQVTAIPNYLIMAKLGWVDTYLSLIVPAIGASMGLYLMKQFMEQLLPDALLEAARIDGAGEIRIFFRIVMPIVKPAWITLAILTIQSLWGTSGGTYIYSEQLKPLSFALSQIAASGVARTGVAAAVSVVMMIVPIVTFVFSQSQILETMATSGMKD